MTPLEEIRERGRRNVESARRTNAVVCIVIGSVFGFFALGCFVIAVGIVVSAGPGDVSVGAAGVEGQADHSARILARSFGSIFTPESLMSSARAAC
jgi:hypothetical protein